MVEFATKDRLRRLTAGHMATHRERVLSRLLARLLEVQRFDNLTSQSPVQAKQLIQLWKHIRRCPHYQPEIGVARNIHEVQKMLKEVTDRADRSRFGRWTEKMKQDKHAYAWLRRDAHPVTSAIRSSSESTAGASVQESLKNLKHFWSEVWQRHIPDPAEFWEELIEHTPQIQPSQSWPQLTPQQIAKAVTKAKGSAAGLDGWTPEELSQFSPEMFSTLAHFFDHCENIGRLPDAWMQIRQVHLGKGKPKESDGSCHANDLRPIAVSSIWWRVLNNTRYQMNETQQWLTSVMPAWVYGGIPGKGVQDAMSPLLQAELQNWVLASLDLTKAFDHGDPRLVHRMLLHLGMPSKTANLLLYQWSNQNRYLQLLGETLPEPAAVATSLPQGDCWSMIGMTSLLIPITNHILTRFPNTIMTVYADDRSYASPTPAEAVEVANCWDLWTRKIGLVENHQKRQFFHRTKDGRQQLLNLGLHPSTVSDTICILGFYMVGNRQRKSAGKETIRLNEAMDRAKRARALPGPKVRLAKLLRTGVAPKATWGHVCRFPSKAETKRLWTAAKAIHGWPQQASMPLVKLIVGHWWDLGFHATCTTLRMLIKHVESSQRSLYDWPNKMSGWTAAIRKGMSRIGYTEDAPWKWSHPYFADFHLHPDHLPDNPADFLCHTIREAWRKTQFDEFINSNRRDAEACRGTLFNSEAAKTLRLGSWDPHIFAAVTGALVSPLCFEKMTQVPCPCPWCGNSLADLEHIMWNCTQNPHRNSDLIPFDILQKRLAWPTGPNPERNLQILHLFAATRQSLLEMRYDDR